MTRVVWDTDTAKKYETGLDRGVLYPLGGDGVAWNGLLSVAEDSVGGERSEFYRDGTKFADAFTSSEFSATLTALTAPVEFYPCVGEVPIVKGFYLTRQQRKLFSLAYRTKIGTTGYKLHLIYNATAQKSSAKHQTIGKSADPEDRSWKITAVPPVGAGFTPTAHFIINSTETSANALRLIEAYLYGNDVNAPAMPPLSLLLNMISK